ncbi:hypothetical protein [Streptomyces sp. N50]|nr:hypothetical protein [Streptomyces sp. N50]WOX09833.1 hypothetical protein R2B38_13570 [Streptomyces sp. N50]
MVARPSAGRRDRLLRLGRPDERAPQLGVIPVQREQLVVGAVLDDAAVG